MKKTILLSILLIILVILGIKGFNFIEHKQKIAGLEKFHKLTLEDPLFYSSLFDSKAWEKSIKTLKSSEDELKKASIEIYPKAFPNATATQKNDYTLSLQDQNLFPYQFLQNLISINQKTNEFLKKPSQQLGKELLALYGKATDSYTEDIDSKIKALGKIDKKDNIMKEYLIFPDSISSYRIVMNDFLVIKENATKLKEEVEKRRNCLTGKGPCLIAPQDNQKINSFVDSLNAKFDLKGEKVDFIRNNTFYFNGKILEGPYKIHSLCWQNPDHEQWLYLLFYNQNNNDLLTYKLANQNYYQKIPKNSSSKIYKALLEKGSYFIFQPETTTYRCPDSTFQPQLLTIDFLKKRINKAQITKEDLTRNKDYVLLIENQFSLISPIIDTIAGAVIGTLNFHIKIDEIPPSQKSLLAVRSVYSIFSFPFAKSIWRTEKKLQYFVPENEKPIGMVNQQYVTLDELRKLGYSDKQILRLDGSDEEIFLQ